MFPVVAHSALVVEEWASQLADHLGCSRESIAADGLEAGAFSGDRVRVELMDGSTVTFHHAFALVDEARAAIAVFTEHCGHHVFPFHEASVYAGDRLVYRQGE